MRWRYGLPLVLMAAGWWLWRLGVVVPGASAVVPRLTLTSGKDGPAPPRHEFTVDIDDLRLVADTDTLRAYHRTAPNKELWQRRGGFGDPPLRIPRQRALVVLGSEEGNLACVTYEGRTRWKRSVGFLRYVVASRTVVVYSDHDGVLSAVWKPGPEGADRLQFMRQNWRIEARRVRDGKVLWSRKLPDTGDACAITGEAELWTVRIGNPRGYYVLGKPPQYHLELRNAYTGRLRHAWRLPDLWWKDGTLSLKPSSEGRGDWSVIQRTVQENRGWVRLELTEVDDESVYSSAPERNGFRLSLTYDRQKARLTGSFNGQRIGLPRVR